MTLLQLAGEKPDTFALLLPAAMTTVEPRLTAPLIALCIALLGTYGVMTQIVSTRQRDHALRLALGAVPAGIAAGVVRSAAAFTFPGLILGVGSSLLLSRFLDPLTFGVEDRTRWICAGAGVVMLVVVAAATLPSALRAGRVRVSAAVGSD